jgi:hypothetical protein
LRPPLPWRVLTGLSLVLILLATIVTAVMAMIGFSGLKLGRRGSRWRDGHSRLILMRKCTTNIRASTSTMTSMPASAVKNLLTAKSATAWGCTQLKCQLPERRSKARRYLISRVIHRLA